MKYKRLCAGDKEWLGIMECIGTLMLGQIRNTTTKMDEICGKLLTIALLHEEHLLWNILMNL